MFKPAAGADLSGLPGWDSNSGTLTGSVTVVVSSIDSTEENSGSEESSDSSDSDSGESYGTDDKEENGTDVNESDADTSVKETEDSTAENEEKNDGLQDDSAQERVPYALDGSAMLARAVGLSIVILSGITAPDSIPEEFSAYAGKVCPPISVMEMPLLPVLKSFC